MQKQSNVNTIKFGEVLRNMGQNRILKFPGVFCFRKAQPIVWSHNNTEEAQ